MDGVAGVVSLSEFLDEGTDTALGGGGGSSVLTQSWDLGTKIYVVIQRIQESYCSIMDELQE